MFCETWAWCVLKLFEDRTAVSRRPLTAEARVHEPVSPCGFCKEQSGSGTDFSPSSSVFPCQYHYTRVSYSYDLGGEK
jgi:hypothetical protein